jgi:hypothetical protein
MLQLPASVTITRNKKVENQILEKARVWLEKGERTPGLHASDLLDIRQAYWKHVKPLPLSARLIPMFLIGKVLHAFVLNAVDSTPMDLDKTDEGSFYSEELGISFSPDHVKNNKPRELKTSRSFYEPKTAKDVDFYLEQLLIYIAGMDTTEKPVQEGQLWVLYMNLKDENGVTTPQFRCYTVNISREDLEAYKAQLKASRIMLEAAIKQKKPEVLPLCRKFKCGEFQCEYFSKDCKPKGRFGIDKKKWQV